MRTYVPQQMWYVRKIYFTLTEVKENPVRIIPSEEVEAPRFRVVQAT